MFSGLGEDQITGTPVAALAKDSATTQASWVAYWLAYRSVAAGNSPNIPSIVASAIADPTVTLYHVDPDTTAITACAVEGAAAGASSKTVPIGDMATVPMGLPANMPDVMVDGTGPGGGFSSAPAYLKWVLIGGAAVVLYLAAKGAQK